jgi:hypothetical protein
MPDQGYPTATISNIKIGHISGSISDEGKGLILSIRDTPEDLWLTDEVGLCIY